MRIGAGAQEGPGIEMAECDSGRRRDAALHLRAFEL